MAKTQYTAEEIAANPDLKEMQDLGFDIGETVAAVVGPQGGDPPADPPPAGPPPADPPANPPTDPPQDPPTTDPPPAGIPPTLTREKIEQEILSEMFGGSFKSVKEAKEAKVGDQLKELGTLREKNQTLEQTVSGRPLGYANENIALFNQFVLKTGVSNWGAFNKLMNTEIDKLEDLDIMVMKEVMDKPNLIGQEVNLRKKFEKHFQLDPDQVDESELELNKLTLQSEAEGARKSLTETKAGIVLPAEAPPPAAAGAPPMTPEQKESHSKGWKEVTDKLADEWKAFPVIAKGGTDPILTYVIPPEIKQNLIQDAYNFCIENQTELNEENVSDIFGMMKQSLVMSNLPDIIHSVAEKVRGMTEEEYDKVYHNPSAAVNTDHPDHKINLSEHDQMAEDIYNAEIEAMGGGGV